MDNHVAGPVGHLAGDEVCTEICLDDNGDFEFAEYLCKPGRTPTTRRCAVRKYKLMQSNLKNSRPLHRCVGITTTLTSVKPAQSISPVQLFHDRNGQTVLLGFDVVDNQRIGEAGELFGRTALPPAVDHHHVLRDHVERRDNRLADQTSTAAPDQALDPVIVDVTILRDHVSHRLVRPLERDDAIK